MLAGILIAIVVVVGLAFALPWATQSSADSELADDPEQRFSNSVRILRRDVEDYRDEDASIVSTPLTRRAQLHELRMLSRQAARRRLGVVSVLMAAVTVLTVLALLSVVPWWSLAIPGSMLLAFVGVARFSVVAMHRSLDARADATNEGFGDEDTETIDLAELQVTEGLEISVDLSVPTTTGILWEPIPVTPATYVSQPLLPRTVRTIDLSAPVSAGLPVVPTAEHPSEIIGDARGEAEIQPFPQVRSRAVGE